MKLEYVVILVIAFIFGGIAGVAIEKQAHTPENIWALCQASPSVVWKSGSLEVRQNPRKHPYACMMYLDGNGNILPVLVYQKGKLKASRVPMDAVLDPQYSNAEMAASMASL